MPRRLHRSDPPYAKVLVRRVYVNAVCLVDASRPGPSRCFPCTRRSFFELGRTSFSRKDLLGEGITGEQNVAGMWLKYG